MEYFANCNTSTLAPFGTPLDRIRVAHLYRRLGFSASVETIDQGVNRTADALVDNLIDQAANMPPIAPPAWATWTNADYPEDDDQARQQRREQLQEFRLTYTQALLNNNLRDRLSFFWSNHFVTEIDVYNCNPFLYHYIACLERNALGNFKTFVSEIGLTDAMLYYLDGAYNNGNNPNENYARELYELFTLGEGNGYTEEDIIETAKALTGYVDRGEIGCSPVAFDAERFNTESKTILGQTGNWNYDDVINILFEQRGPQIAEFICRKLYEFFVHPDSQDETGNAQVIIDGLAQTFMANDFEIAPVLSRLFKSEHFFDENTIGVIIKSPYDMYLNLFKETSLAYTDNDLSAVHNYTSLLGQTMFDPFDVAGWQRDRSWINTNFIIGRWLTVESILEGFYQDSSEQFRDFALSLTGNDGLTSNNPDVIARPIIDFILPKGLLDDGEYEKAYAAFRSDVDSTYYEGGNDETWTLATWMTAPFQVYLLLQYLARQPEFQLK
ncbi:MAG: DUF1800 domain-containing protein [Bacteroidota bacterium]